eukprot:COSAG06_NODE_42753_length_378_cov_6.745520_2_plen_93_part_01
MIGFIVEGCTQQGTNKRQEQTAREWGGDRDSNKTHTAYCKTATQPGSKTATTRKEAKESSAAEQSRAEQSRGRSYALCHGCEAAFRQRGQELH